MFSGIVEEVGRVESYDGRRLTVSGNKALDGLSVSDSILVSGACLTVVEKNDAAFTVETVSETVNRTALDEIAAGDDVNLERSLSYGDRVGGHLVQGHVDCTGRLSAMTADGISTLVYVDAPANIMRYIVEKGFIALDGISLTVVDRCDTGFSVAIIPYTKDNTTLRSRKVGDRVNLEADITAKYLEQLTAGYLTAMTQKDAGVGSDA
jgi:riboflavin synthase